MLNEWRLEELLGAGSVAATYAARRFGERSAIRILHEHLAVSKTICERFLAVADIAQKVDHPGLVRILAADTTRDGEVFLVTELLSGETLEAAWKGRELHRLSNGNFVERDGCYAGRFARCSHAVEKVWTSPVHSGLSRCSSW